MKGSLRVPVKHSISAIAAGCVILTSSAAFSAECLMPDEMAAEQIQRLQTTLMIGALQCRNASELNLTATYNSFIKRHGPIISAHNQTLSDYFKRTVDGNHERAMDRHVTTLANVISSQANKDRYFCLKVSQLGLKTLNSKGKSLREIAIANTISSIKLKQCSPQRQLEANNGH